MLPSFTKIVNVTIVIKLWFQIQWHELWRVPLQCFKTLIGAWALISLSNNVLCICRRCCWDLEWRSKPITPFFAPFVNFKLIWFLTDTWLLLLLYTGLVQWVCHIAVSFSIMCFHLECFWLLCFPLGHLCLYFYMDLWVMGFWLCYFCVITCNFWYWLIGFWLICFWLIIVWLFSSS